MTMVKMKFDYDKENDILFVYDPKRKSHGSIEMGSGIVIDFDCDRRINAVELISASELLSTLTTQKITKENLEELIAATMLTKTTRGVEIILLMLAWKEKTVEAPVTLPDLRQKAVITAISK